MVWEGFISGAEDMFGGKLGFKHCPGIRSLIGPGRITVRTCPSCGGEVEFFGGETEVRCPSCGHVLRREAEPSCVAWCRYAEECIADLLSRGLITSSRAEELKRIAKREGGET